MTPMDLRNQVIEARQKYGRGEITVTELHTVADRYIESLKEYKRVKKVKLSIPSRAYLLRAL